MYFFANPYPTHLLTWCTVLVRKSVEVPPLTVEVPLADVFRRILVLSVSISVSNSKVVERPSVVIVSVTMACSVSTMSVPGPDTVAVNAMGCVVVNVLVTTTTSQTSWYRLHSRSPLSRTLHILTSTSEGVSPAVIDCHGAT